MNHFRWAISLTISGIFLSGFALSAPADGEKTFKQLLLDQIICEVNNGSCPVELTSFPFRGEVNLSNAQGQTSIPISFNKLPDTDTVNVTLTVPAPKKAQNCERVAKGLQGQLPYPLHSVICNGNGEWLTTRASLRPIECFETYSTPRQGRRLCTYMEATLNLEGTSEDKLFLRYGYSLRRHRNTETIKVEQILVPIGVGIVPVYIPTDVTQYGPVQYDSGGVTGGSGFLSPYSSGSSVRFGCNAFSVSVPEHPDKPGFYQDTYRNEDLNNIFHYCLSTNAIHLLVSNTESKNAGTRSSYSVTISKENTWAAWKNYARLLGDSAREYQRDYTLARDANFVLIENNSDTETIRRNAAKAIADWVNNESTGLKFISAIPEFFPDGPFTGTTSTDEVLQYLKRPEGPKPAYAEYLTLHSAEMDLFTTERDLVRYLSDIVIRTESIDKHSATIASLFSESRNKIQNTLNEIESFLYYVELKQAALGGVLEADRQKLLAIKNLLQNLNKSSANWEKKT